MTYPQIIQSVINRNGHGPSSSDCGSHFGFKNFQLEDYACGALHDGLVLGHDTGGGKSLALFTWPALKVGFQTEFAPDEPRALRPLAPVLLVVPGDLHHKTIAEDAALMKAKVTILDSQETFLRLSTVNSRNGKRELPPGYYLIPELHSALKLIQQCMARGEQTIVFSAFNGSLVVLSARLTEAGVAHCVADGRTRQKRRSQLSAQFKLGHGRAPYQVMRAGIGSIAEAHSYVSKVASRGSTISAPVRAHSC